MIQQPLTVQVVCYVAALLAMWGTAQAGECPEALSAEQHHPLQEVAVYSLGLLTGRHVVNLDGGRIEGIGWFDVAHSNPRYKQHCMYSAAVSENQLDTLKKLIGKLDLLNQPPNPSWFANYKPGKFRPRDGGGYLVVKWDDQEMVIALPYDDVVNQLPVKAQRYYKRIEEICGAVFRIRRKCVTEDDLTLIVGRNFSEMEELGHQLDDIKEKGLPRNRSW
jgi:hypothetical protein